MRRREHLMFKVVAFGGTTIQWLLTFATSPAPLIWGAGLVWLGTSIAISQLDN